MDDRTLTPYQRKLLDPRWQKKRLQILERDSWMCMSCFDSEQTLHVHHMSYERGRDPWDYDDSNLITLCATCHAVESSDTHAMNKFLTDSIRKNGALNKSLHELACVFYGTLEPMADYEWPVLCFHLQRWLSNYFADDQNRLTAEYFADLRSKQEQRTEHA